MMHPGWFRFSMDHVGSDLAIDNEHQGILVPNCAFPVADDAQPLGNLLLLFFNFSVQGNYGSNFRFLGIHKQSRLGRQFRDRTGTSRMIYNSVGYLLSLGLCQGYIFQLIDEMKVGRSVWPGSPSGSKR
jgi:hypothetical protein